MAVKIRNSKTQEEKTVPQELWEKMRSNRKNWYAVGSDGKEAATVLDVAGETFTKLFSQKPVAVRAAKPKAGPEAEPEAPVLTEN